MASDTDMRPEEALELFRAALLAAAQVAGNLLPQNPANAKCLERLFEAGAWAGAAIEGYEPRNKPETENESKQ